MNPLFEKHGIKHLSASQIKTMKRSPFTWVCEKVLGMRSPATEATAFGTFIHENFEARLKHREEITPIVMISDEVEEFYCSAWDTKLENFWEVYQEKQPGWPDEVEHAFRFQPDPELPPFIGKIDALTWNTENNITLIQDHKTIGNKSYAPKKPEDLIDEDQLIIYAAYICDKTHELDIDIQHDQLFKKIKTKKNTVNILTQHIARELVNDRMASILQDAHRAIEILGVYDEGGIEAVAHRYKKEYEATKWDFGGCKKMAFFEECLAKKNPLEYNKRDYTVTKAYIPPVFKGTVTKITEGETKVENNLIDLHELVGKARDFYTAKGKVKFDLADNIVESTMKHIDDENIKSVFVRAGMTNGGDLVYNQILNQLAEKGVKIYERIN